MLVACSGHEKRADRHPSCSAMRTSRWCKAGGRWARITHCPEAGMHSSRSLVLPMPGGPTISRDWRNFRADDKAFISSRRPAMGTNEIPPDINSSGALLRRNFFLHADHLSVGRCHQPGVHHLSHDGNEALDIFWSVDDGDQHWPVAADQMRLVHFRGFAIAFQAKKHRCPGDFELAALGDDGFVQRLALKAISF